MARKEINIFGTSFLDLLSGALGAVIILFLIVPKMTRSEQDALEKIKELQEVAGNIEDLLDRLEKSVPRDALRQIEAELTQLRENTRTLERELAALKEQVRTLQEENTSLREQLEDKNRQLEEMERQLEELRRQVSQTQQALEEAQKHTSTANTVEKTLGVFAKFGILCRWQETDTDVDIGVQKFGYGAEHCWRMYPSKPWGILGEDVRERDFDEEERFELFYVPKIHPEVYTAWCNIYENSRGRQASVMATLIFHPGKADEQRREIGPIHLYGTKVQCFVTFRLSDYGFDILSHREPEWGNGRVVK